MNCFKMGEGCSLKVFPKWQKWKILVFKCKACTAGPMLARTWQLHCILYLPPFFDRVKNYCILQLYLRFRVWRACHGCAGGRRGGRTKGRVLADVLCLAPLLLVLLLLRLHAPFPCWRYVRLLTGQGKRIYWGKQNRAISRYWMSNSNIRLHAEYLSHTK